MTSPQQDDQRALELALHNILAGMEQNFVTMQNNVLSKLDMMAQRINQLESTMQVIIDKSGINKEEFQQDLKQQIEVLQAEAQKRVEQENEAFESEADNDQNRTNGNRRPS